MNNCCFIGNIGHDWEVTYTQDGKAVGKNSMAIRKFNGDTMWINLTAFGKRAETLARYTQKGSNLGVQTAVEVSQYEKNGENRYFTSFIVENFTFTSGKQPEQQIPVSAVDNNRATPPGGFAPQTGFQQEPPANQANFQQPQGQQQGGFQAPPDDGIPF